MSEQGNEPEAPVEDDELGDPDAPAKGVVDDDDVSPPEPSEPA